jgi:hypothetical protein
MFHWISPRVETELIGLPGSLDLKHRDRHEHLFASVKYGLLNLRNQYIPVAALNSIGEDFEPSSTRSNPVLGIAGFPTLPVCSFRPTSI